MTDSEIIAAFHDGFRNGAIPSSACAERAAMRVVIIMIATAQRGAMLHVAPATIPRRNASQRPPGSTPRECCGARSGQPPNRPRLAIRFPQK
jgi:hypothetical protein